MLTKDECEWAMVNLNDPDFVNEEDISVFAKLIEEHFSPKPLDYMDLKEDTWVWDTLEDSPVLILKIFNIDNICYRAFDGGSHRMGFYENRFYPINIPFIKGE